MHPSNYVVKDVISGPKRMEYTVGDGSNYVWWDVVVTYIDDNDEENMRTLSFDNRTAADNVKEGYEFIA